MTPLHPIADKREARARALEAAADLTFILSNRVTLSDDIRSAVNQAFITFATADQQRISEGDGYVAAFYELGDLMGLSAQSISPERVWCEQMLPRLKAALAPRVTADVLDALKCAESFIANGVALGFIRMPDADTPDPAHETLPKIRAAIRALISSPVAPDGEGVLAWLTERTNLELHHYSPVYGDDDDLSEEWRVTRVSGPVNDKEWTTVGRGETALAAIQSAIATHTGITPEEIG